MLLLWVVIRHANIALSLFVRIRIALFDHFETFYIETDVVVAFQQIQNVLWIAFDRFTGFLKERIRKKLVFDN